MLSLHNCTDEDKIELGNEDPYLGQPHSGPQEQRETIGHTHS